MKLKTVADKKTGHYLGTEVNGNWWKRYRKDRFFMRGMGRYWFEEDGFCFHRYLTRIPIKILFRDMQDCQTGSWHSGKWCGRNRVVKIIWSREGARLSSGFVVARNQNETAAFIEKLKGKIV